VPYSGARADMSDRSQTYAWKSPVPRSLRAISAQDAARRYVSLSSSSDH